MGSLRHVLRLSIPLLAAVVAAARADIIHLKSGRVEGTIVKRTKTELVVETTAGKVMLNPADVVKIERRSSPLELYREMAKEVDANDAEAHYKLGLWCLDQKLFREASKEFERAVALEPDHKGARERLGYVRRDGTWLTRAEAKRAEGFVRYKDRWVTEEQREGAKRRGAVLAWRRRLHSAIVRKPMTEEAVARRIAGALGGRTDAAAQAALRAVLYDLTKEANESRRDRAYPARIALADAIGLQRSPRATELLRRTGIVDRDDTVRAVAVKALAAQESIDNTAYFVGLLRTYSGARYRIRGDRKTRSLARKVLRRASQALGDLGDPRAVAALANAMVVRFHISKDKDEIPPITFGFSTTTFGGASIISDEQGNQFVVPMTEGSNWGLGQDDAQPKAESALFFNDAAYSALRKLTRKDFGHDKRSWLAWWYRNRHDLE